MYSYRIIKNVRKLKGMTIEDLSKKSGISSGYICHLENGTRMNPSIEVMEQISKALNKTVAEIFFNEKISENTCKK